jgi:hypothetical protein
MRAFFFFTEAKLLKTKKNGAKNSAGCESYFLFSDLAYFGFRIRISFSFLAFYGRFLNR